MESSSSHVAARAQPQASTQLLFNQLMDTLPDFVYFKDRQSRFIRINRSLARHFHLDNPAEAVGKTDFDFFDRELAEQKRNDEEQIMVSGVGILEKEEINSAHVSEDRWVSTTKLPLIDEHGNTVGIFGISRDITDAKRAYDALAQRHHQMETELGIARNLQVELIRSGVQNVCDARQTLIPQIAYRYLPSEDLAGDSLQAIPLTSHRFALLLCDVMGHGIKAALVTILLRGLVNTSRARDLSPVEMLQRLNDRLCTLLDQPFLPRFITAVYAIIDTEAHTLEVSSAGHPWPMLQSGGDCLAMSEESTGPALGLIRETDFPLIKRRLAPSDRLFFYTDGCIEAATQEGEEFGEVRLAELLKLTAGLSVEASMDTLLGALRKHTGNDQFSDDLCVILVGV